MKVSPKVWLLRVGQVFWDDIRRFYAWRNLVRLAIGFAAGALLANLPLSRTVDERLEAAYRERLHADTHAATNLQWAAKQLGDRYVVTAAPIAAMALGLLAPAHPVTAAIGSWGVQFTRAFVVATPLAYGGTWLLGGDRPKEGHGSAWQPQRGKQKGISGHAMAGSLSFLVMAGMTSNPLAQTALYACSGLSAWSRVDSRSHYPSQVFLGWWLSFLAMRVVRKKPPAANGG
jgi:membrane-associated phospholipid phosphatase